MKNLFQDKRKTILYATVTGVHVIIIGGVIIAGAFSSVSTPPEEKVVAFKVKLDGDEPSRAEEIGPQERTAPAPEPPAPEPPAPEPPAPEPPAPEPPAPPPPVPEPPAPEPPAPPPPKPKPKPPKPKPPKPKPPKPKPKPKPDPQKALERKRALERKKRAIEHMRARKRAQAARERARKRAQERAGSVHHDNRNGPIGDRNRGQTTGKPNNRKPAGGMSAKEAEYWNSLPDFIKEKWVRPPGILVDENTAVTVEIYADANGRILRKRISKRSPNAAVNHSAEQLLNSLSYIPRPPNGAVEFEIRLVSE